MAPAVAVADAGRPEADRALDAGRKPVEMLVLAGLKPGERVMDVMAAYQVSINATLRLNIYNLFNKYCPWIFAK